MAEEFHGVVPMVAHAVSTAPFWLALAGAVLARYLYLIRPGMAEVVRRKAGALVTVLEEKYYFDRFNDWFFAGGARKFGTGLWRWGDVTVIDGLMVNGSAKIVGWLAGVVRWLQSGFIYHYAFVMIIGVSVLLTWFVFFGGTLVR
jgi:NADH-quinone oxidoreductase subunit L